MAKSSDISMICVVGVVFISVLGLSWADYWPGDAEFQTICRTIIDDVFFNQIRRRGREFSNGGYEIVVHETLTQRQLCDRLVIQHNTYNYDYLGIVSSDECVGALNSPDFYSSSSWNNWRGRHCGHWRATGNGVVGNPECDDALWDYAHLSYGVYYRQNVDFFQRQPCCEDGWNESGGTEIVVWGWDPKEAVDHFGWQGSHVGWPFRSTLAGADCIVWLTGEEAFLECIKTEGSTKRRTSAGLWGFGQWVVQTSNTQFCQSGSGGNSKNGPHLSPVDLPIDSNDHRAIP